MAALLYKDFFIIAMAQFDKDREPWMSVADISWHSASGYESHTIKDSVHCFGTKQEAEAFAIEAAKAWVGARVKADLLPANSRKKWPVYAMLPRFSKNLPDCHNKIVTLVRA